MKLRKKLSTEAIGKYGEKKLEAFLYNHGFKKVWFPQRARFNRTAMRGGTDIFGMFDCVAISGGGSIWFFQVKTSLSGKPNVSLALFDKLHKFRNETSNGFWIAVVAVQIEKNTIRFLDECGGEFKPEEIR